MLEELVGGRADPEAGRAGEELQGLGEGAGVGFVGGGGAAVVQVLQPQLQVASELAEGPLEDEVDQLLPRVVAGGALAQAGLVLTQASELFEIQFVGDVAQKVALAGRAATQQELKVTAFGRDGTDFLL